MGIIRSPNPNVAKDAILDLEDVQLKIKSLISQMILKGASKTNIEIEISPIIYNYLKYNIKDAKLKKQIEQSLLNLAQSQYFFLKNNMETINATTIKSLGGSYSIDLTEPTAMISQDKFRGFTTKNMDTITPIIEKYQKLVKNELHNFINQPAKVVSKDNKISLTSARNFMEMKVRYEANIADIQKEKKKGTKFVWISSHANCSPRCAPYQGRLYSLDGTSGTIAGNRYVPLEEAQRGKNGDGNGCTNGYNCRHYIIPTSDTELIKGQKAPTYYNKSTILKEQAIDTKQRFFENQIRKIKKDEIVSRIMGNTEEARKNNEKWKKLEKKYEIFSLENKRAFYRWRTQISREEETLVLIESERKFFDSVTAKSTFPLSAIPKDLEVKNNQLYLTTNRLDHIKIRHPEVDADKMMNSIDKIKYAIYDRNHYNTVNLITERDEKNYYVITVKLSNREHVQNSIISGRIQNKKRIDKKISSMTEEDIVYK